MHADAASTSLVVLVDDDVPRAGAISAALRDAGYSVSWAATSIEGLIAIEDTQPALVVLRWHIPLLAGPTFLQAVQIGLRHPPPVVVLAEQEDDATRVLRLGARACVGVPVDTDALVATVHTILGRCPATPSR